MINKGNNSMIQKVQIISNNICYGPPPENGAEVEQHLTISASGRIWFNGYNFIGGFDRYEKGRTIQLTIGKEKAQAILKLIEDYLNSGLIVMATDCGSWNMKVTLIDGTLAERDGALIKEIFGNDTPISQTIREIIPIEDMFLFDGNYTDEDEELEYDK